jgi:hypothetical protein
MITPGEGDRDDWVEEDQNGGGRYEGVDDAVGIVAHGDPPGAEDEDRDRHADREGRGDFTEFAVADEDVDLDRLVSQEAVSAADLPQVAVGIGKGAGVSPILVSDFHDDLGASLLGAAHQVIDLGIGGQADHDKTLMRSPRGLLTIADYPAEADGWNQHHTKTIADLKPQRLGYAIGG